MVDIVKRRERETGACDVENAGVEIIEGCRHPEIAKKTII